MTYLSDKYTKKTNSSTTDVSPKNAAYHLGLFCLLKGISSKNEKDSELIGMGKYNYKIMFKKSICKDQAVGHFNSTLYNKIYSLPRYENRLH